MTRHFFPQVLLAVVITALAAPTIQAQGRRSRTGRDDRTTSRDRKAPNPATSKLPDQYRKYDKDGDGQVGLYEWPRTAGEYAEFKKLDLNGDGFLTPQELSRGSKGTAGSGSGTVAATTSAPTTSTSGDSASEGVAPSSSNSTAAERAFGVLDKNKDGKVTEEEWKASLSTGPTFAKAGIRVTFPLGRDEFFRLYPQAYPNADK